MLACPICRTGLLADQFEDFKSCSCGRFVMMVRRPPPAEEKGRWSVSFRSRAGLVFSPEIDGVHDGQIRLFLPDGPCGFDDMGYGSTGSYYRHLSDMEAGPVWDRLFELALASSVLEE